MNIYLIFITSVCSYGSGVFIEKYKENRKRQKKISAANIVVNLMILGVFKYYNFFVSSFANVFLDGETHGVVLLKVILPVGISFYTFQALSYSIDVYKGKLIATKDLVQFLAFVSFFPQLVAGPIERATNLLPQFGKERHFDYNIAVDGIRQALWGLFKKIVIADNCAVYVDRVFDTYQTQSGSTLFLAAILFTFQIYSDFSGYSDIAIGTAKLFGFRLMRNFNVPYFSRDIAEFWRRWHISLTTWFRDYVYIPLGGSRVSKMKVVRNTFVIFLLSGFWHGANWTFVIWGGYHALLFLPLILLGKNRKHMDVVAAKKVFPGIKDLGQMGLTFFLVVIGWIVFRADSIGQAWGCLGKMCGASLFNTPDIAGLTGLFVNLLLLCVVEWVQREKLHGLDLSFVKHRCVRIGIYLFALFVIFAFGGNAENFIYFQF